jgi:hypothetical protein
VSQQDMIFEVLKADLVAPRTLLTQVLNEINDRYTYPQERLPAFFSEKFPQLEDYEVDLLFSPQYTPAEHHRLEYIPILGGAALTENAVKQLRQQLAEEKLTTVFCTEDAAVEVNVPVHEVFIDRYVNLLKLDNALPDGLYEAINRLVPTASRNEANLLARDVIWHDPIRVKILLAFLDVFQQRSNFSTVKLNFLTNFIRTYRPTAFDDLPRQFESLIESCRKDMENVDARGFHDEYLKALNTDNNLVEPNANDIWAHYREMMKLAEELKEDFAHYSPEATAVPNLTNAG